jgi:uncharacterized protein YbjT (DUF2867 family)
MTTPVAPATPSPRRVFIAGANGYMGSRLADRLIQRGHRVTAFVRSAGRSVPEGCVIVRGDALNESAYAEAARGSDTLVHLVGVAHPSPSKATLFETVDLASARTAARAASTVGIRHIVYVSVARPTPVMHAYISARQRAEEAFAASGIACTFLQPWYVVGPGHYWPLLVAPAYKVLECLPPTRATALRLGLVSTHTMLTCLVRAIEDQPTGIRSWDVPTLRRLG